MHIYILYSPPKPGVLFPYLYSINSAICRPLDCTMGRSGHPERKWRELKFSSRNEATSPLTWFMWAYQQTFFIPPSCKIFFYCIYIVPLQARVHYGAVTCYSCRAFFRHATSSPSASVLIWSMESFIFLNIWPKTAENREGRSVYYRRACQRDEERVCKNQVN